MSRTGERGKPVNELKPAELQRELRRCRIAASLAPNNQMVKLYEKRIHQIEKRLRETG